MSSEQQGAQSDGTTTDHKGHRSASVVLSVVKWLLPLVATGLIEGHLHFIEITINISL